MLNRQYLAIKIIQLNKNKTVKAKIHSKNMEKHGKTSNFRFQIIILIDYKIYYKCNQNLKLLLKK